MQDLCSHQQDQEVLSSTSLKIIFSQLEFCQEPPSQWQKARVEPHTLALLNSGMCHNPLINTSKTQLTASVSHNLLETITTAEVSGNMPKYWGSWLMPSTGHCFCKAMVTRECHWCLRQSSPIFKSREEDLRHHSKLRHLDLLEGDVVNSSWKPFPSTEGQDESSLHEFMAGKSHTLNSTMNNVRWDKSWCVHSICSRAFDKFPTPRPHVDWWGTGQRHEAD